jgi:hypothetical protein
MHPTIDEQLDGVARLLQRVAGDLGPDDPTAERLRTAAGTLRRIAGSWAAMLPFLTWDNAATVALLDVLDEATGSAFGPRARTPAGESAEPPDPFDAEAVHARNLELRELLADAVRGLPPNAVDGADRARAAAAAHVRARIARDPSGGRARGPAR